MQADPVSYTHLDQCNHRPGSATTRAKIAGHRMPDTGPHSCQDIKIRKHPVFQQEKHNDRSQRTGSGHIKSILFGCLLSLHIPSSCLFSKLILFYQIGALYQYGKFTTKNFNRSDKSFCQRESFRELLSFDICFVIKHPDLLRNPVSYTHLDVYKRQILFCLFA